MLQVDHAYLQYGPEHNIVAFMQSLGYSDFKAVSPDEEKITQFKRALKLTRPAFAATRTPMQQVTVCPSELPFTSINLLAVIFCRCPALSAFHC